MLSDQQVLQDLVKQWRQQHFDLDAVMEDLRSRLYEIKNEGAGKANDLIDRLRRFRERLVAHFEHERELGQQLAALCESSTPEVEATKRQSAHDQLNLLTRIDALIDSLQVDALADDAWQKAFLELELILNELERHEDQEEESLDSLCPKITCEETE